MLFGGHPEVAVAPLAEVAEFLHFGVCLLGVVFDGEGARVEDPHVAA